MLGFQISEEEIDMKKIFRTFIATLCCTILLGTFTVSASTVEVSDSVGLVDNCLINPGKNVAPGSIGYWLASSDYKAAYTPSGDDYAHGAKFPENAFDGNLDTYALFAGAYNAAYVLDLRKEYDINRLAIYFHQTPVEYDIYYTTEKMPNVDSENRDTRIQQQNDRSEWGQGLKWLLRETGNAPDPGWHEFNLNTPIRARYIIINDSKTVKNLVNGVALHKVMMISEIQVNEVSDFYTPETEGKDTPVFDLRTGSTKIKIKADPSLVGGGKLITSVFDKEINMLVKMNGMVDINADGTAEMTISNEYGNDYTKLSSSVVKAYAKTTPDAEKETSRYENSGKKYQYDLPGKRSYGNDYDGYPCYIDICYGMNAFDGNEETFASTANSNSWTFFADFDEEKIVSAVDITFTEGRAPTDYEIGVIDANGERKTVKTVIGSTVTGGKVSLDFEPTKAKTIYVYDTRDDDAVKEAGNRMGIAEMEIYDKAPKYEMRAFVWNLDELKPLDGVRTLK